MLESLVLNGIGTFFGEKSSVEIKKIGSDLSLMEKIHVSNLFQIIISFGILIFTRNTRFHFDYRFLGLLLILIVCAIGFNIFVMKAIENADRSANGLFSILAIPLLLISDIFFKYDITTYHIIGIIFIVSTLVFIGLRGSVNLKGVQYTIITQMFSFVSIMIFKFVITEYTSTEIINILTSSIMFTGSLVMILFMPESRKSLTKSYNIRNLKFGIYGGLGSAFNSMGYVFGPASIVTALKRIFSMFWGVVMGKIYFHEEKFYQKLGSVGILSLGVIIMNFQSIVANQNMLASVNSALLIKGDIKGYAQRLKENDIDINKSFNENISRPEQLFNMN